MKKEKTVRAYQRRTKSGKVVTVRQHTAKYDAAEDLAKEKGAGGELMEKKKSLVKEAEPAKEDDLGFTAEEFKEWYRGTGSAADKKVAKALRARLGRSGYRKFEDEAIDNYSSRGHLSMFKRVSGGSASEGKASSAKDANLTKSGSGHTVKKFDAEKAMNEIFDSEDTYNAAKKYLDKSTVDRIYRSVELSRPSSSKEHRDRLLSQIEESVMEKEYMLKRLRKPNLPSPRNHVKEVEKAGKSSAKSLDSTEEPSGKKSTGKINIKTTMPKTFKTPIDWTIDYDHSGWDGHKSYSKRIKARSEKEAERIYKQMYHIKGETTLNAIRPSKSYDNMDSFKTLGLDFNEIMKRYW